jgi:hypothetical protein
MTLWDMGGIFNGPLPAADFAGVHARSPTEEKVALFRPLFRGRQDV